MTDGVINGPRIDFGSPPQLGLPEGTKDGGNRSDFREELFDQVIENKGMRMAWSQQTICPCPSVNRQTQQPDPNCPTCKGSGFAYFRPDVYSVPDVAGELNPLQKYLIERPISPAVVIRALQFGHDRKENSFDRVGTWVEGSTTLTVRHDHKLAHFDRLTYLDAVLPFSEVVIADAAPSSPIALRFPAVRIDYVAAHEGSTLKRYDPGEDFACDGQGRLQFLPHRGPSDVYTNNAFTVRYLYHPQFLVTSHMNALRMGLDARKLPKKGRISPVGNPQDLPIRVMAQLEYLAGPGASR